MTWKAQTSQRTKRRCHEAAKARGWRVAGDFTDEGSSGAVADLTRLSRSTDLAPLLERLKFRSVRVVGALDGYDSDSSHSRMQAGLSGMMSDEMRSSIRVRTHSALEMRAKAGTATGGKCYGYDSKGAVLGAEAAVVREIFERAADGTTLRTVANDLNTRKVPSPGAGWKREARRADGVWLISALHAMLHNPRYVGRLVWNRSTWVKDPDSGKRTRRERPSSEWTVADCPAIVDARTWGRVETLLNERAPGGGHGAGVRRKYVLSGLLICEPCSSAMIVQGAKGSHYGCATHQQGGAAACSMALLLRRDAAEHHLLEPVRAALLTSDAVDLACEQIREAVLEERLRIAECPDADLAAQVAELEALLAGNTTLAATLRPALEALRTKQAAAKRVAWRRAQAAKVASVPAEALYRVAVRALVATLEGANIEAARAAVRSLVGTVPVFEQAGVLWGRIGMSGAALLRVAGVDERAGSGGPI